MSRDVQSRYSPVMNCPPINCSSVSQAKSGLRAFKAGSNVLVDFYNHSGFGIIFIAVILELKKDASKS